MRLIEHYIIQSQRQFRRLLVTTRAWPIETRYWVLTSVSRITTSSMSVAEGYYISKSAQVLKGRVVKTPRLRGVCLVDCDSELLHPQQDKDRLGALQRRHCFLISLRKQQYKLYKRNGCWSGLWFKQEGLPVFSM